MIAYRVVAVPERLERAERLSRAVGGKVILDEYHEGTFPTHRRALHSAVDASHVVVLEDDAIVCGDFIEHVTRLVEERPDHLLGLYVGRRFPKGPQGAIGEMVEKRPAWLDHEILTSRLWWAVGYVMPVADIPFVLERLAEANQHPWLNTDMRLGRWHVEQGRLSYPFPSPVDHDDTLPSITSSAKHGRVAWIHCGGASR
jgi:hypothetical protein